MHMKERNPKDVLLLVQDSVSLRRKCKIHRLQVDGLKEGLAVVYVMQKVFV